MGCGGAAHGVAALCGCHGLRPILGHWPATQHRNTGKPCMWYAVTLVWCRVLRRGLVWCDETLRRYPSVFVPLFLPCSTVLRPRDFCCISLFITQVNTLVITDSRVCGTAAQQHADGVLVWLGVRQGWYLPGSAQQQAAEGSGAAGLQEGEAEAGEGA